MSKQYHKWIANNNEAEKENANGLVYLIPYTAKAWEELLNGLDKNEKSSVRDYVKDSGSKPEAWSLFCLDLSSSKSVAIGFLPETDDCFQLLKFARRVLNSLHDRHRTQILLRLQPHSADRAKMCVDVFVSANRTANFETPAYGKKLEKRKEKTFTLLLEADKAQLATLKTVSAEAERSAQATNLVRTLMMTPANKLNCSSYVTLAKSLAKKQGLTTEFWNNRRLKDLGAGCFTAVSQGSRNDDAGILRISYQAKQKKAKSVALVGKGIMFDTGGVNVKPGTSMYGMHTDMMGSALVLALVLLAAEESWPFSVDAYLAIAENAISEIAFRPNEVVIAANGLSIETVHTDAEGRMVLSDTLHFAAKSKPDMIMDFATLTGTAIRAIGTTYSAVFTNKPAWAQLMIEAGRETGERIWPFPLDEDFGECLESDIADTKQCRLTGGVDHIEAAMFLQKFVDGKPWIHMDLAASEHDGGLAHVGTKETGFGVRVAKNLLFRLNVT